MTITDGNVFTVEELSSPDGSPPLRVDLRGRDAPLGGRGSGGAFEIDTEVRQTAFYYPGNDVPTRHVMGVKRGPIEVSGNLQDRGVVGRAAGIARTLEQLAERQRRVRISWGPRAWLGLVDRVRAKPEGLRDYEYTLSLHIDGPDLPSAALAVASAVETTPVDLGARTSTALASLGDDFAATAGASLEAVEAAVASEARLRFVTAAEALVDLVAGLSDGTVLSPLESGRIESAAASLASVSTGVAQLLPSVPPMALRGWPAPIAWQRASTEAAEAAWDAAEAAVETSERLERLQRGDAESEAWAREGDTLESIARRYLGDENRAGEIARRNALVGYRLTAGQHLVLPAR